MDMHGKIHPNEVTRQNTIPSLTDLSKPVQSVPNEPKCTTSNVM